MDEQVNGSFQDVLNKLRRRLIDAKRLDVGTDAPQDFVFGVITNLMSECERQKNACLQQAQSHKEQARAAEYQATAFATVHSMAFSIYDGFIRAEERAVEERKAREAEKAANAPAPEPVRKKKRHKPGD